MARTLVVVGAGAKAAALAARASLLRELLGPHAAPKLKIFERRHIASA